MNGLCAEEVQSVTSFFFRPHHANIPQIQLKTKGSLMKRVDIFSLANLNANID